MSLDSLRVEIDELDSEIVRLIGRRASVAQEIGRLKEPGKQQVYDPAREQAVYDKVVAANAGPLKDDALRAIYREIMSASLALERLTQVAFFGPHGTFTHSAARRKFGMSVDYVAEKTIPDVFSAVTGGRADYGVVPVENSTEGPVNIAWDMLADTSAIVIAELYMPIHLALLGHGPMSSIRRVYSHSQPLAQARRFIAAHLSGVEIREAPSTIAGVETACLERGAAAIAGEIAAEGRDIEVLATSIEDSPDNETRFFVIGTQSTARTGHDKTALMVSIKDEVGALHSMLGAFRERDVNLTRIQSRPSRRRAWDYVFFLDCEGHIQDENVAQVVSALEGRSRHVQLLGSFPAAARGEATS